MLSPTRSLLNLYSFLTQPTGAADGDLQAVRRHAKRMAKQRRGVTKTPWWADGEVSACVCQGTLSICSLTLGSLLQQFDDPEMLRDDIEAR